MLDQLWFTGEVRSLTGPIRGKGEFVTGGGLYGYDISAGRPVADGMRLKLSLKTDERPLTDRGRRLAGVRARRRRASTAR